MKKKKIQPDGKYWCGQGGHIQRKKKEVYISMCTWLIHIQMYCLGSKQLFLLLVSARGHHFFSPSKEAHY